MKATVPFDQMKVSERRKEPRKKSQKKVFPQSLRKLISSTRPKSNQDVTLKTRETCFLYKNPQIPKIGEKIEKLFKINGGHLSLQNSVVSANNQGREFSFGKKMKSCIVPK